MVAPVDFFVSALIRTAVKNLRLRMLPRTLFRCLAVEFALIALKADARHAEANHGERD
jgi:hypothetical protein